MIILAIESSCDETAVAVVEKDDSGLVNIVSHNVASSEEMHIKTGGIVPEVAAREQLISIIPILNQTLLDAGIAIGRLSLGSDVDTINEFARDTLDAIAVTQGPGLIGSLLVGVETGKSLAITWEKPLIPVNHLLGHLYANWITPATDSELEMKLVPCFPLLALIVSGGHTSLVMMKNHQDYHIIGQTRDDAAGECFDKCARAIGLPYPGGPNIAKLANSVTVQQCHGVTEKLPRPLLHDDTYDVSFSGLKAAFVRQVNQLKPKDQLTDETMQNLAYELQSSVTDTLSQKVLKAIEAFHPKSFLLAGGVAANLHLRKELEKICKETQTSFYKPEQKYCVDNAAMIGAAAIYNNTPIDPVLLKADPSLTL